MATDACLRDSWKRFCLTTDIQGLRHVVEEQPFTLRRLLWVIFVLVGMLAFSYHFYSCLLLYLSRPTSSSTFITRTTSVPFPTIVICNQNVYRLSETFRHGWTPFLDELYSGSDVSSRDIPPHHQRKPESTRQAYEVAGHKIHDLLVSCAYNGKTCGVEDFESMATPSGMCFVYNGIPRREMGYERSDSSQGDGLNLLLNLEEYEYGPGSSCGVGFRLYLEDPDVPPRMSRSFYIPAGVSVSAPFQLQQFETDVHCTRDRFDGLNCIQRCQNSAVINRCGCKEPWMPDYSQLRDCDIGSHINCSKPFLDDTFNIDDYCQCVPNCHENIYDTSISYMKFSDRDAQSMREIALRKGLNSRHIEAIEIAERVNALKADRNVDIIAGLGNACDRVAGALSRVETRLGEFKRFLHNVSSDTDRRASFHHKAALNGVRHTLHHGVVDGWRALDERTVQHVTSEFYETISALDDAQKKLNEIQPAEKTSRKIVFSIIDAELSSKLEVAIRAIDNLTSVYLQLLKGVPLMPTHLTPRESIDIALVPKKLLNTLTEKHSSYYEGMSTHLTGYMRAILDLKVLLQENFERSLFNETAYNKARSSFIHHSKQVNYFRFHFANRVIYHAQDRVKEREQTFLKALSTYQNVRSDFNMALQEMESMISDFYETEIFDISSISKLGDAYLKNITKTKHDLLDGIYAHDLFDMPYRIRTFFQKMKSVGSKLPDILASFQKSVSNVLKLITKEEMTKEFYSILSHEFRSIVNESEIDQYVREVLGHESMLNLNETHLSSISNRVDISKQINIDILKASNEEISDMVNKPLPNRPQTGNINILLSNYDTILLSAVKDLQDDVNNYESELQFDSSFVRDNFVRLSIKAGDSHIYKTEAYITYGLFQFIADIGGLLSLFVGASVVTILEFLDLFLHYCCVKTFNPRMRTPKNFRETNSMERRASNKHLRPAVSVRSIDVKSSNMKANGTGSPHIIAGQDTYV